MRLTTLDCPKCHHSVTIRSALLAELKHNGGEGPFCKRCHAAGRPDSLMLERDRPETGEPLGSGARPGAGKKP